MNQNDQTGQIVVERGIPVPTRYPFAEMAVGDSFLVPAHVKRSAVSVSALRYGKANGGKRFTVRKTQEGALRCWRIK